MKWLLRAAIAAALLTAAHGADAKRLRLSTENTPAHFQTQILERFARRLERKLSGALEVKLITSGALFRGRDVVAALSAGRVDIAAPGVWHLGKVSPGFEAILLPSFFGRPLSYHREQVDDRLARQLSETLERDLNIKVIGPWLDLGYAHLFFVDKKIRSLDELRGLRMRVAGGKANVHRLEALGASPVVVPFGELPLALKSGVLDGVLTTPMTVVSARLWESGLNYMVKTRSYFPYYVPLMSAKTYKRLSPQQRAAVAEAWADTVWDGRAQAAKAQVDAERELRRNGVQIFEPAESVLTAVRERLMRRQDEIARKVGVPQASLSVVQEGP